MLSKLDAVNQMLLAVGSGVTNSISGQLNRDVAACKQILERIITQAQLLGWHFNTDYEVPFAPNNRGHIDLPEKTLKVDVAAKRYQGDLDPVQRGTRLYDRAKRTFTWTKTIYLDIVTELDWDELPEAARQYIAAWATEEAVTDLDGDPRLIQQSQLRTIRAKRDLVGHETSSADVTIFDDETEYNIRHRRR